MSQDKTGRRRRSSSLIYTEPPETIEQLSDQSALPNLNAEWVNAKGGSTLLCSREASDALRKALAGASSRAIYPKSHCGDVWQLPQFPGETAFTDLLVVWVANSPPRSIGAWTIHIVLIICLKIFYDIIPGVSQETSWTLTNISYMFGSYLMFHWVQGVPFDFNAGAYDNLNMWEQIDNGDQYTPAKKFLLSVPIVLFLLSTHYTHYDLTYFTINFLAVLGVVIPKLPSVSGFLQISLPGLLLTIFSSSEPSYARGVPLRRSGGSMIV